MRLLGVHRFVGVKGGELPRNAEEPGLVFPLLLVEPDEVQVGLLPVAGVS